jgi:3-hydroxy-9,10-secoandrosta-1,3,5(10)-triene-9,17-dione monooxygenase
MHEAFRDAGFYRLHVPRRYGGLEQSITAFYRVIMSVSRGCPSTGWMLSLGAGHAQQAAAFFPQEAQYEFFGGAEEFVASASFQYEDALATPVEGGYRVHGTSHF